MTTLQEGRSTRSMDWGGWLIWSLVAALIIAIMVAILYYMGRTPFPKGGTQLWYGVRGGTGQSVHFTDVFTFTHVVHGPVFFLLLWLVFTKGLKWALPAGVLFALAVSMEAAWEILENTNSAIARYRKNPDYTGYAGDTIINSVGDILAMILGYVYTMYFRGFWPAFGLVAALEVGLFALAGDNFTISFLRILLPGIV